MDNVRVRFAPSPTGFLHVGGARTALYNWLFARKYKGTFVLRIEDTDILRSREKYLEDILFHLKWLKLDWDEEMVKQSDRFQLYTDSMQILIDKGLAYKTDRPPKVQDEVDTSAISGEVVVFRVPKKIITINDLVHGDIQIDTNTIDDFIIMRSNGTPTYNFACVVDDADMRISHLIRGDDHISNTPKQIMLYEALECEVPHFAHAPMILGEDGSRLSKRHGATSVGEYNKRGILPEALNNFLALLGWSPGNDIEFMNQEELISLFSLDRITGKSAVFNYEKLVWMNGVYISKLNSDEMTEACMPFVQDTGLVKTQEDKERFATIAPFFTKRIKLLSDIVEATEYFFTDDIVYPNDAVESYFHRDGARELLELIKEGIEKLTSFTQHDLEGCLRAIADKVPDSNKRIMQTLRLAVTGRTASPSIFDTLLGLGQATVVNRLTKGISLCEDKEL